MNDKIERLLAAMNYREAVASMFDQYMTGLISILATSIGEPPPIFDVYVATSREEMLDKLPVELSRFLEGSLTESDIDTLTAFYESDVSKKFVALMPDFQRISEKLAKEVGESILHRMLDNTESN